MYTTKPDVVYDHDKGEFRQFGTTDGKTLLPIYIIGVLLAILLYIFFYYISKKDLDKQFNFDNVDSNIVKHQSIKSRMKNIDDANFLHQQLQLQTMQCQLDQLINHRMTSQILYNQEALQKRSSNALSYVIPNTTNDPIYSVVLPNHLSV